MGEINYVTQNFPPHSNMRYSKNCSPRTKWFEMGRQAASSCAVYEDDELKRGAIGIRQRCASGGRGRVQGSDCRGGIKHSSQALAFAHMRRRANMAHIGQPRPDSGLGFQ